MFERFDRITSELTVLKKLEETYLRERELIRAFLGFFYGQVDDSEQSETFREVLQEKLKSLSKDNPNHFDFISFNYYDWSLTL